MALQIERCCDFLHTFKKLRWNKISLIICFMPLALVMFLFIIILLCSVESLGAVVSNSLVCAKVGEELLAAGGSAADAAIGTMLCEGIALPNAAGIGGGFVAITRIDGRLNSIVATPSYPGAVANAEYANLKELKSIQTAGVPGELMGYWEMHQKYGMLPWRQIIQPSIELCEKGITITEWISGALRHNAEKIQGSPSFRKILPVWTSRRQKEDLIIKFPVLAKTLKKISDYGAPIFYKGEVGEEFIKDVQEGGGVLTVKDLRNYKVLWNNRLPSLRMLQKFKVITTPLPTSGAMVVLVLNVIKSLGLEINSGLFWHYVVEAMKESFSMGLMLGDDVNDQKYAKTIREAYKNMSDMDFARIIRHKINAGIKFEDAKFNSGKLKHFLGKGSANICVLAPNGDIVVATSSLIHQFGAFFCSDRTGIIVNSLSTRVFADPHLPNRPLPYKHILTPYAPVIVLDHLSKPYFIVGASGGIRSIAVIINAIIRYVIYSQSPYAAINADSLFPELSGKKLEFGRELDANVYIYLKKAGHNLTLQELSYDNYTAATCIGLRSRRPMPQFDDTVGGSKQLVKSNHELGHFVVAMVLIVCISVFGLMLFEVLHPRKMKLFTLS